MLTTAHSTIFRNVKTKNDNYPPRISPARIFRAYLNTTTKIIGTPCLHGILVILFSG